MAMTKVSKKGLIISLFALMVALVVTTTSTYAWFAMNTQVTATGMQVTAKSDNTYLLIGTGDNDTASEIQTAGSTTVALTVSAQDAIVLPSAPALTSGEAAYLPASTGRKVDGTAITTAGVQVTNAATAAAVTNWYTAQAATVGAATINASTARQLTTFNGYVIQKTVYLTVAQGANPAGNLSVTPTITQKTGGTDVTACKMIITTSNGGFVALNSASGKTTVTGAGNITDEGVVTVNIYIYYDGNDSSVYTNNAANLSGADIDLAFDVEVAVA